MSKLQDIRRQRGITQQNLADLAGTSFQQISKLENGERKMSVDWANRLGRALGVAPAVLTDLEVGGLSESAADFISAPVSSPPPELLPVRSAARAGNDDELFLQDGPIDYRPRSHSLQGVANAYFVQVCGESMSPRFRHGQILHINPHRTPTADQGVVVYKTGNRVLVKDYVRKTATHLVLRQYNPPAELTIPLAQVREIHMVVTVDEV